jgi:hypothetical protein
MSTPVENCKFDAEAIGVITHNVKSAVAAFETTSLTVDFRIGANGDLFKVRADGNRLRGWPFPAADDLSDVNGMCWVYISPRSLDPGYSILDGEGAIFINPKTLAVVRTTWFRY